MKANLRIEYSIANTEATVYMNGIKMGTFLSEDVNVVRDIYEVFERMLTTLGIEVIIDVAIS